MSANNQSESSISIEESNAIRLKLGLAPLTLTNEDEKTVIITSANTETDIPTEPKKKPNSRILIGKGLGAVSRKYDQQDLDALEWIQKSRNLKQKRPEKPRSTVQNGTYTNESLEGIRISHSMASFEDSAILTLKDSFIGAEDQTDADVLENIDLVDKDRVARNIELSKGKRYNAYEDGDPTAKSILSQYDTPEPENGFVIGHGGKVSTSAIADQKTDDDLMKKKMVSLEAAVPIQNLDYYTQAEMTFRKPRKVRRSRKKEAGVEAGFVEDEKFANSNTLTNIENVNFVDDDELQESLMDARRNARKGIVGVRIGYQDDDHSDDDGGDRIVISETSEFVDNLAMNSAVAQSEIEEDFELQSKDVLMSQEDLPALESNTDQVVKSGIIGVDDIVGQDDMQVTENIQEAVVAFQEPLVSTGMAATLALLKHQGILTSKVNDQTKDAMTSQRLKWQATQSRKILQAKLEADQKRQSNKQKGESGKRTQQIHVSAQETERLFLVSQQEKYKDYVPIVNLEYKDEYGRTQTPKEVSFISDWFRPSENCRIGFMEPRRERRGLRRTC